MAEEGAPAAPSPAIYRTLTLLFTLQKPPHFAHKLVRQRISILPLRYPYLAAPTVHILLIYPANWHGSELQVRRLPGSTDEYGATK